MMHISITHVTVTLLDIVNKLSRPNILLIRVDLTVSLNMIHISITY